MPGMSFHAGLSDVGMKMSESLARFAVSAFRTYIFSDFFFEL